jgi:hypothetical protein
MKPRDRFIILCIALTVVLLVAALIEPCDGHSCTKQEVYGTR